MDDLIKQLPKNVVLQCNPYQFFTDNDNTIGVKCFKLISKGNDFSLVI